MTRALHVLVLAGLAACGTTDLREGPVGPGLMSFDREPPAGVELFERPQWTPGDRFVYQRGGVMRLPLRVEAAEAGYALVHEEAGTRTLLSEDLGAVGVETGGEASELIQLSDPVDAWLSWPLWVGKQWSCGFVRKGSEGAALPLNVQYECDAIEEIKVPAGTFRALRIVRRARVASQERYFENVTMLWYAPEVGYFVRRLENSTLVDLEEYQRQ